ncbi:glycosyltransferase family 9 protein [Candidatus Pacearchaeota archaeon]|nr:glycosyltransferase family 9 protein [Candidatus Pacearchaeota archaeon]
MKEICIIKLGAMGDVVRTLPILEAIKEKYPESNITWITKENIYDIFQNNPNINELITLPNKPEKKFDILYNFDIEEDATSLAQEIEAEKKLGFYSEGGYASPFNMSAEYYLNTLFDDEIKKTNPKTYQEMMFEAAELEYKKQPIKIYLTKRNKEYARNFIEKNKIDTENLIGLNIGSSPRWPSKVWSNEKIKEFIVKANKVGYKILLFGGPNEKEKLPILLNEMKEKNINIYSNDPNNTLMEFAAVINICEKMVCPDSLSMHISLALEKPTIGMFFCTSSNEVEEYNTLTKIVSPMQKDFFPERMDEYNEELINSISTNEVLNKL